jgi:DHA1 family bicyclomycin/chloramphenicol resistance-like MFS transporter
MGTRESRLITGLLIAIIAITDMATDIYVPTLPTLVDYFETSVTTISWTISVALFGFCFSAPLYGPLSDSFGRRRIFIIGLVIFSLGNLACSVAFSAESLIFSQFIQGTGQTVGYVVGIAMVRDLYSREAFSKVMSYIHMVVALAPALAPIIGSYVGQYYGWQTNFIILFVCGCFLLLLMMGMPETLKPEQRKPFNVKNLFYDYKRILSNGPFLGYAFISGIIYSGLWIYMAEIPHIFNHLFVEKTHFGYYSAFQVMIFIVGAYINSQTIERLGVDFVFRTSLWLCFLGSFLFIGMAWFFPDSSYAICGGMSLFSLGMGGVFANASTGAMDQFPEQKGTASASLACIENLIPAITLSVMAVFYDRTTYPVSIGLLITTSLALATHQWIVSYKAVEKLRPVAVAAGVGHKD